MVHQFPVLLAEIGIKDRDRMEGFINLDFFHLLLFLLANPSYQIGDPIPPYLVREGGQGKAGRGCVLPSSTPATTKIKKLAQS